MDEKKISLVDKAKITYRAKHNLLNGIILLLITSISFVNIYEVNNLVVRYLFPLALLLISCKYLYLSYKHKELPFENYIFLLLGSILLLVADLILLFVPIETEKTFILFVGIAMMITALMDILSKDKSLYNILNFIIVMALATVIVVFKDILAIHYLYLLIILLALSILSILAGVINLLIVRDKKDKDYNKKKDNKKDKRKNSKKETNSSNKKKAKKNLKH